MTKYFLIYSISLLGLAAQAQQGMNIGAQLNLNSVFIFNQNAYGAQEYEYRAKFGGGGGLSLGYNLTDNLGIVLDAMYSKQGQNYHSSKDTSSNTANNSRQVSLNYIIFPLLFQFTSSSDGVKFYANIGPQFGVLSSAAVTGNYPAYIYIGDDKNKFNSSNIGIRFGLGANIPLNDMLYISAGMDFFYGFNDINDDSDPNGIMNPGWQAPHDGIYEASHNATGGISAGIHYLFGN